MSYESGRACENCGQDSPVARICGECEVAANSFEAGHVAGMSDAANELAKLRADIATAKRAIRELVIAGNNAGYGLALIRNENDPRVKMILAAMEEEAP